jgi:hypothetical protein
MPVLFECEKGSARALWRIWRKGRNVIDAPLRSRPIVTRPSRTTRSIPLALIAVASPPTLLASTSTALVVLFNARLGSKLVQQDELALDLLLRFGDAGLDGRRVDRPDGREVDGRVAGGEEWVSFEGGNAFGSSTEPFSRIDDLRVQKDRISDGSGNGKAGDNSPAAFRPDPWHLLGIREGTRTRG